MSNAILDRDGKFYRDVYYVPLSLELFAYHVRKERRLRGLPNIRPSRMERLFEVYNFVIKSKRVEWQNDVSEFFRWSTGEKFASTSHHALLSDFHVLESVGLIFRRAESIDGKGIFQLRELKT